MAAISDTIEHVSLDDLRPSARDLRLAAGYITQVSKRIEEFGSVNPILIDDSMNVIAGHRRLEAAKRLGLRIAPVLRVSGLSGQQKRALLNADSKMAENEAWDKHRVVQELETLAALQSRRDGRSGDKSYTIGFGKPPIKNRFQKGRSGNPSGRPRKSESLDSCISKELEGKIALTESSGERRFVSKCEAFAKRLVNDGMNGKPRAQEILVKHLSRPSAPVAFEAKAADEAAFNKTLASIAPKRVEEEKRGPEGDGS